MSYTEIYKFYEEGTGDRIADIENSWRGAMFIWKSLGEKYLPLLILDIFDRDTMSEVWALVNNERLLDHEKIVMATTFDYIFIKKEHIPKVIDAFKEFIKEFHSDNLEEQIDVMQDVFEDEDTYCIGWCQTSVNSYLEGYNLKDRKHQFMFEGKS